MRDDYAALDLAPDDTSLNVGPSLEVTALSLCYEGVNLLNNVSLEVDGSGITVIMGPNGAGKSVLLRTLHGLVAPTSGDIRWDGQALSPAARMKQALVFQKPVLLRRTVAANIDFVLRSRGSADPQRRDDLLAQVGLLDKAGQQARLLSGGEQQRLALARALATDPEVLLLDEPTASLDPASEAMIERIVMDVARAGVTTLFVTHSIAQARRIASDVVFLSHGRIVEHRAASEFFDNPGKFEARQFLVGHLPC